jgi:hypothetical protein
MSDVNRHQQSGSRRKKSAAFIIALNAAAGEIVAHPASNLDRTANGISQA